MLQLDAAVGGLQAGLATALNLLEEETLPHLRVCLMQNALQLTGRPSPQTPNRKNLKYVYILPCLAPLSPSTVWPSLSPSTGQFQGGVDWAEEVEGLRPALVLQLYHLTHQARQDIRICQYAFMLLQRLADQPASLYRWDVRE